MNVAVSARRLTLVIAVLCVLVGAADLALGLGGGGTVDAVAEARAVQHARTAAVAAARTAARDLLSYDYRTMDRDIARAKSETTGLFAGQYASASDRLAQQAKQARAIVQASPSAPGVVSASRDQVVVLLFVDQASVKQTPGQRQPTTRIDQSRVRMTMTLVRGRWLVSQLAAL